MRPPEIAVTVQENPDGSYTVVGHVTEWVASDDPNILKPQRSVTDPVIRFDKDVADSIAKVMLDDLEAKYANQT